MSQNAIERITEAEQKAEVLCRAAEERAAAARDEMEKQAKAHLDAVERNVTEKNAKNLAQTREHTQALIQKKRELSEKEAEALAKRAQEKMDAAVGAIVWGIVEKCQ